MSFTTPDYQRTEEYQRRSSSLEAIRALGIEPYPHKYTPTATSTELHAEYEGKTVGTSEDGAAGKTRRVTVAGRLVLFRAMGKISFATLQDGHGRIQVMFNTETQVTGLNTTEQMNGFKFLGKMVDLGDWIGVEGHIFRTNKGELTVMGHEATLLCKSLLPLPEKHAGLTDKGVRYRKRWLDLISNEDSAKAFKLRSQIVQYVRNYFFDLNYMEVELPIIQNCYGGAAASPFTTHLNALNQDMYLRIALEISLKKLIIGGMERIFEIGKCFRNEGIDKTHNPEFTMIEAYATYLDYNDMMVMVENLFEGIAKKFFGSSKLRVSLDSGEKVEVDLTAPWKRISMKGAIKEYAGIDVDVLSHAEIKTILKEKTHLDKTDIDKASHGMLIAYLFEELAEPHLIAPHHIIDHPIETTPLCKLHRDPKLKKERIVERFETFILGREYCNAYSELNDPLLQRELLEEQAAAREAGDEEASPLDEEFIEAICQGLPPTGGLGIGIDRLVMLFTNALTNQDMSIRDVLYFPLMRPEN